MKHRILYSALVLGSLSLALFFALQGSAEVIAGARGPAQVGGFDRTISDSNERLINDGRQIFRFDRFSKCTHRPALCSRPPRRRPKCCV